MKRGLIVVTGASSGIGAATAKQLSELGYALLLVARRKERMVSLQLPNCMCAEVDVTESGAFAAAVSNAEKEFGPVEGMINNAGIMLLGDFKEQNADEWEAMIDLNVKGVLRGTQLVLKGMIERQSGTLINISSIAGRKSFPSHAAYCATKFAIHGFSETLREEVANSGVRVVTIAPGATESELLGHTSSSQIKANYESWKKSIGGPLLAEDVARAIVFALTQPPNVCIREIVLAATRQGA